MAHSSNFIHSQFGVFLHRSSRLSELMAHLFLWVAVPRLLPWTVSPAFRLMPASLLYPVAIKHVMHVSDSWHIKDNFEMSMVLHHNQVHAPKGMACSLDVSPLPHMISKALFMLDARHDAFPHRCQSGVS